MGSTSVLAQKSVSALQWSQIYMVGHPRIDQQHAYLFELYNLIAEAFESGLGHGVLEPALQELLTYAYYHFREEEQLMERLGYRGLAAHRRSHQRLIAEVKVLITDFRDGQPVRLYELLALVRDWLIDHILQEDMQLRPLLAKW